MNDQKLFLMSVVFLDGDDPHEAHFNATDLADAIEQAQSWHQLNRSGLDPVASVSVREFIPGRLDQGAKAFTSRWGAEYALAYICPPALESGESIGPDDLGVPRFGEVHGNASFLRRAM